MIVDAFIARLGSMDPAFFASIEGIAELAALTGPPAMSPAVYVFESESVAAPNDRMTSVLQRVEIDVAVVIVVTDVSDPAAGAAARTARALEDDVMGRLLGWCPEDATDVVTFVGAKTVKARGGEIWRELTFATARTIQG